jgi:hypothetical protein
MPTLEELQAARTKVWDAILKGTGAQKLVILGRVYERPPIADLRALLQDIDKQIKRYDNPGARVRQIVPTG